MFGVIGSTYKLLCVVKKLKTTQCCYHANFPQIECSFLFDTCNLHIVALLSM
jgi:hypothetical protein